jgi:hypothetical protein
MVFRSVLVLLLASALVSCGGGSKSLSDPDEPQTPEKMEKELTRHEKMWKSTGLRDYSYKLNMICYCTYPFAYPVTIRVKDGKVVSGVDADGKIVNDLSKLLSIPELFDATRQALYEGQLVRAMYDATQGFPTAISLDRSRGARASDAGILYTARMVGS